MQYSGVSFVYSIGHGMDTSLGCPVCFSTCFLLLLGGIPVLRGLLFVTIIERELDFLLEVRKEARRVVL